MREIRKVAVIGSGVMGGGIAAQVTNGGVPVLLFDMTREIAAAAIERLLRTEPAPFMVAANARLMSPGGIDTDLEQLKDCDWIVEAIVEKAEVKRNLYARIDAVRATDAIVSSNTSTIPLAELTRDAAPGFARNFLITHFFNPPRYMRLLEIVRGPRTSAEAAESIGAFADRALGKSIVNCKDRPGFIANRLGCFWLQAAIAGAIAQGITVEEADAVLGRPFGIPNTGVFGLADLVGIDLLPQVNASLAGALAADDLFHSVNVPLPLVAAMIADGRTGRKGSGGFYRINREAGKRKEALDLITGAYRPLQPAKVGDAATLLADDGRLGRYARSVMLKTLAYAALLVGDAADDIASIDAAMRLGYNWTWGPFELIGRAGVARVAAMIAAQGLPLAPILKLGGGPFYRAGAALTLHGTYETLPRPAGVLRLADFKNGAAPILGNGSGALWDIGDGIACLELTTKMNTLDRAAFDLLDACIAAIPKSHRGLVIHSDAANFSAGVDLKAVVAAVETSDWPALAALVDLGQRGFKRLKYAPFPSVAAVAGLALGGGCELLMHCSGVQAHAESNVGLTEAAAGLLPAWGGCGELLLRLRSNPALPEGPMPAVTRAFEIIATGAITKSAAQARELGFLRAGDGITMNRDRLLADAKAKALALTADYRPPEKLSFTLPGPSGLAALQTIAESQRQRGKASDFDMIVATAIATVLMGGDAQPTQPVSEAALLDLEKMQVLALGHRPESLARMRHLLDTGKPLRN